jgi:hypothetical protein
MSEDNAALRKSIYVLLIVAACGTMIGRIWTVQSSLGSTPLLSANDRSRWATVRALVDHGTFELDEVIFLDAAQTRRNREWYSIDMVRHRGADGREHYYSSKPPLLATLVAGKYWLLKQVTGITLGEHPFYAARFLLITTNVIPMALYFLVLASLVERFGKTDWGRLFAMICATFGTFLTTFSVTLTNHLPAAVSAVIAIWAALAIWRDGQRSWLLFAVCGFFAAFTVTNELPALAFFALLSVALFWQAPRLTLLAFLPGAAIVAAGFFGTNYIAHGTWRPPYTHRHDGPLVVMVPGITDQQMETGQVPDPMRQALSAEGIELSQQAQIQRRWTGMGWMLWDPVDHNRLALVVEDDGVRIHRWGDWYEYERSYWTMDRKAGVDRGEPSRLIYAMNVLVGHRGIFSLTPIWVLSVVGAGYWLVQREQRMRGFALLVLGLSGIILVFYLLRPLEDRNYGGVSCAFRWMIWLTPLWLIALLPAADRIAPRRAWRGVAGVLLLISVISASYASLNPWTHSWIYQYWAYLQWIQP